MNASWFVFGRMFATGRPKQIGKKWKFSFFRPKINAYKIRKIAKLSKPQNWKKNTEPDGETKRDDDDKPETERCERQAGDRETHKAQTPESSVNDTDGDERERGTAERQNERSSNRNGANGQTEFMVWKRSATLGAKNCTLSLSLSPGHDCVGGLRSLSLLRFSAVNTLSRIAVFFLPKEFGFSDANSCCYRSVFFRDLFSFSVFFLGDSGVVMQCWSWWCCCLHNLSTYHLLHLLKRTLLFFVPRVDRGPTGVWKLGAACVFWKSLSWCFKIFHSESSGIFWFLHVNCRRSLSIAGIHDLFFKLVTAFLLVSWLFVAPGS